MTVQSLPTFSAEGGMLAGKVVIVTGGAGGVGTATVKMMAVEGACVVVNDLPGRAGAIVEQIRDAGFHATAAEGDVSREEDIERMVAVAVETYGRLDSIMNNATNADPADGAIADMDVAVWDANQAVGLRGPMLGCKHAVRQFLKQKSGGSIINVSSTAGYQGDYRFSSYAAAKAGIMQLTRSVATQYGKVGIRCNTILPGCVVTPTQIKSMGGGSVLLDTRLTPRLGEPVDIAYLAVFLASDRSAYMTGQDVRVDGGGSAHQPWIPHIGNAPV